jgi:hypothetical protein
MIGHQLGERLTKVRSGSWSCKNAPAEALTAGDLDEVGALGHFREFDEFLSGSTSDADSNQS